MTVIQQDSPDAADSLEKQLQQYQQENGMTTVKQAVPGVPSTIVFQQNSTHDVSIDRGIWVCGNDVIWVNVVQQPTKDLAALTTSFQREIVSLTQSFPAQ